MNSQVHYTTEIGRLRRDEAQTRAQRYRQEQQARIRARRETPPSSSALFIYRRALKIAALSVVVTGLGIVIT